MLSRIFYLEIFVKNNKPCKIQDKYLICAWKLSLLNEGNYALKIDGGRQTERRQSLKKHEQYLGKGWLGSSSWFSSPTSATAKEEGTLQKEVFEIPRNPVSSNHVFKKY